MAVGSSLAAAFLWLVASVALAVPFLGAQTSPAEAWPFAVVFAAFAFSMTVGSVRATYIAIIAEPRPALA